ncbi:MAG: UbiX family flavin prenyltransferase, partial [Planctomycetes bacterium]|nr:UbiX family flavin prenyltransferase [Planctomycetota bacterium]
VHVTISAGFFEVAQCEMEGELSEDRVNLRKWTGVDGDFHYYHYSKTGASIASGSFRTRGMIVAPCSSSTLGCIANGTGKTLVERAADVTLKEGRKLALLLRESPLSAIALENALRLARTGVHIVPPCPAFYVKPKTIDDIVDFSVARVLDLFEIEHKLSTRWGEEG